MTTFTPGDRFRLKGRRTAHFVEYTTRVYGPMTLVAQCGTWERANLARAARVSGMEGEMAICDIELVTIAITYDGPLIDLVCKTHEEVAPGGTCPATGQSIDEDDPRHLVNTYLKKDSHGPH